MPGELRESCPKPKTKTTKQQQQTPKPNQENNGRANWWCRWRGSNHWEEASRKSSAEERGHQIHPFAAGTQPQNSGTDRAGWNEWMKAGHSKYSWQKAAKENQRMEKSKGSADYGGFRMKREKGRHWKADGIRALGLLKLRGDMHTQIHLKDPTSII